MDILSVEDPQIAVRRSQYPDDNRAEFLLVGRSNVGKSSFINTLIERKNFARTSSKPGKTQTLNFYHINNDFYISKTNYVDLYLVADMLRMKEDISYEMIADAHATALKEMIRELFSITDDKYNDYDVVVASKNIEFMIRACLSLINDDYFDYIILLNGK